jgi:hypothetical protein
MAHVAASSTRSPVPVRSHKECPLQALLQSLQESRFAIWMLESSYGYPVILTLHTTGLAVVVGVMLLVDLRVLGRVLALPLQAMRPLMKLVWWAFLLNLTTGLLIFVSDAERYYGSVNFRIKISAVLLAIALAVPVQRYLSQPESAVVSAPGGIRLAAGSSIALWAAAIVSGRLMAYF